MGCGFAPSVWRTCFAEGEVGGARGARARAALLSFLMVRGPGAASRSICGSHGCRVPAARDTATPPDKLLARALSYALGIAWTLGRTESAADSWGHDSCNPK